MNYLLEKVERSFERNLPSEELLGLISDDGTHSVTDLKKWNNSDQEFLFQYLNQDPRDYFKKMRDFEYHFLV